MKTLKHFFVNEECYKNGNLKNTPTSNHKLKKKRVNTEMGEFQKLRFNNIDDYDFKGQEYIAFWGEKESIAEVYIQSLIPEGMRESCLSTTAHQIKALNQEITKEQLLHLVSYINHKCCVPPLPENEILKIVNNKDRLENAELIYNKERRVIFNPDKKLNKKQKSFITNGIVGEIRKEKSKQKIRDSLDNWDFECLGKITQQKLVKVSGLCKNTIESYGKEFRERIKQMNEDFKNST
ncbi:hypothetical protein HX13_01165 [Chryseobacterium sp. P1-3]|uniref:hypothetical protein n=1 Tax=Chryseobacterium sp. (strain P1-3) TaxID=1517683 RepID=UPI0004E72940|nr:hypothetical protein [Chryseobacterium sp. P1-3]KFF75995.1 hypothetical protein HX13_01165 [Chryseobacterium sp. P1-3]